MSSSSYAIVREGSGEILRTGECSPASLPLQAVEPDEILIHPLPSWVSDDAHYWGGSGFVEYPPRPTPHHQWDGSDWVESRSQAEIDAEAAAELHARRAEASLPKLEFAKRASHPETGFIQPSSGMALLEGNVPPELEGMVNSLPPSDQFALIMDLKGATQFDRLNPFVIAAGQYLGLSDEQMDAFYGI